MSRRLLTLLLVAMALVALFVWWRSDRRRIYARLDEAIEQVSKSGEEDQLTAFGKMRRLVALFSPGFLVIATPYEGSISDPQELAGVVAAYRASVAELHLVARERSLTLDPAKGTAEMALVVEALSVDGAGASRQTYRFRISWVREQGNWWIHEAELLEVETGKGLVR